MRYNKLTSKTKPKDPNSSILLSCFFCQSTDSRIKTATATLRGLLYLNIDQQLSLISHLQTKYDVAGKNLSMTQLPGRYYPRYALTFYTIRA